MDRFLDRFSDRFLDIFPASSLFFAGMPNDIQQAFKLNKQPIQF